MVPEGTARREHQLHKPDSVKWWTIGPEGFLSGLRPGKVKTRKEIRRLPQEDRVKEAIDLGEGLFTELRPDFTYPQVCGTIRLQTSGIRSGMFEKHRREPDWETACASCDLQPHAADSIQIHQRDKYAIKANL